MTGALAAQNKISKGWGSPVKGAQDYGAIYNSAILCYMVTGAINAEDLVDLMVTSSGFDYTFPELAECGERIWHMKRGINNLMGMTVKDDKLPQRLLRSATEGGAAGSVPDMKLLMEEFYPVRGLARGRTPDPGDAGQAGAQ